MKRLPPTRAKLNQLGLTLIEILIGVVVIGVILALATPSLTDLMERRRIVAVAGELAGLFSYAKSETNVVGDDLTLHLEPMTDGQASCARLVTLTLFDNCGCDKPAAEVCNTASKLVREFVLPVSTGVSFEASGTWGVDPYVVSFARNRRYTEVNNVQVTVTGRRTGAQLRIEYNNVGRVRTCSPGGSIGGFPVCA